MLGGVTGSVEVIRRLARLLITSARSARGHIRPQATRELAMTVCTAQKHVARHGAATSQNGHVRSPIVRNSVGSAGGTKRC